MLIPPIKICNRQSKLCEFVIILVTSFSWKYFRIVFWWKYHIQNPWTQSFLKNIYQRGVSNPYLGNFGTMNNREVMIGWSLVEFGIIWNDTKGTSHQQINRSLTPKTDNPDLIYEISSPFSLNIKFLSRTKMDEFLEILVYCAKVD